MKRNQFEVAVAEFHIPHFRTLPKGITTYYKRKEVFVAAPRATPASDF